VHGEIACEVDRMEPGTQVKAAPLGTRVLAAVLDSIVVFWRGSALFYYGETKDSMVVRS
jgi:hypothetical protein